MKRRCLKKRGKAYRSIIRCNKANWLDTYLEETAYYTTEDTSNESHVLEEGESN